MKKRLIFTLLLAAFIVACFAQKPYKVMFYNLENFFDTINDPEVLDDEFTPEGPKQWNSAKYNRKLGNTERVLFDLAAADKVYPAVIGVSEVENRSVLEDIVAAPKLAPADYRIVHYDSPEARGVDVAFLYRPEVFKLEGSYPVKTVVPSLPNFKTRDILTMWGRIDDEPFFFMVAHWPSRLGGKDASEFKRIAVGEQMRRIADSVLKINPATKVVAMGDFNDDPTDESIAEGLGAKAKMKDLKPGDFYNPFADMLKAGLWLTAMHGISSTISWSRRIWLRVPKADFVCRRLPDRSSTAISSSGTTCCRKRDSIRDIPCVRTWEITFRAVTATTSRCISILPNKLLT